MELQPHQTPVAAYKDQLDTVNSLSWFLMDACWMGGWYPMALTLSPIVLLSGLTLCFVDRRRTVIGINVAIFNWILMNITWMYSEYKEVESWLGWSKTFFALGVLAMIYAVATSKNVRETFSHFRRFRVKNWQ